MRELRDRVVVVTGASSGLGRATAVELARRGAHLVLAARRGDALEDTARQCRSLGANAMVVETDVTIEADVQWLAARALEVHGVIDIWINNAGVTLFSPLEESAFAEHKRVIETNLFGAMLGARAALPIFRRQHRGTLINVGSVLSEVGHAFVPSYVISKFGLRGLSEALRVEVADEPEIHVCSIYPFSIDTQHFESAANRIERAPYAIPPALSPEKVARELANLCERPRRMRHVPRMLPLGLAFHALMPRPAERLLLAALRRWHISSERAESTAGNLFAPTAIAADVHGERLPKIATPLFLAWSAARFVANELATLLDRARGQRELVQAT